jgi:predicted solute-binding protein
MPFLFAAWMAREGVDLGDLPRVLSRAKSDGLANVERIIARDAGPLGWPADVARRYLTGYLKFDVGPEQLRAVEQFHALAARHGALHRMPGPLRLAQ